jgi:hypothetical protein
MEKPVGYGLRIREHVGAVYSTLNYREFHIPG